MDFGIGGILGGAGPAGSKEFGSSTASTTFGAYERGRNGGLAPEWMPLAIFGAIALVVLLIISRK